MNIKFDRQFFLRLFLLNLSVFISAGICFGQNKFDLEILVQPAADTARGGEKLSYSITVKNLGSAKATDVIFIQDEPKLVKFISYVPSEGQCEVDENKGHVDRLLRCRLGDVEAGESILVLIEATVDDFGDTSETTDAKKIPNFPVSPLESFIESNSLGRIDVRASEMEENLKNNSAELIVKLLPSKNIPPRVEIVSPKDETTVAMRAGKAAEVTLTIKAYDPDGKIKKVLVDDPQYSPQVFIEDNQYKWLYEGRKYTAQELENYLKTTKPIEREAVRTGKDTYS